MKIQVTKADIKNGLPVNFSYCPIALAVKRKFPENSVSVSVSPGYIADNGLKFPGEITINSKIGPDYSRIATYTIPGKAISFIKRFDSGKPVKAFEFVARKVKP